ncbi:hypothetical protein Bca52824_001517 [Brassica carinata]|uniref:At2g35280-like TPR domain-containing protein n=1 Tax=Brassica carinata TaxID=52824 RepID=A0A8X8BD52_BRACI|nr:hypothetical protein Bca52824_001517 [Brassica carinata]
MGEDAYVNNYDIISIGDSSDSKDNHSNSDRTNYFRNLSLSYFAAEPTEMLEHKHLKELFLENDNPEAHYIEGILQYFLQNKRHNGLFHLRQSSIGNYKDGTYLYGLLLLALERFCKGEKYLDKLKWKENLSTSDQCWERVKKSLSDIPLGMNPGYHIAMTNLEALCKCHKDNMAEECNHGYYYQRLSQFVQFAMNRDH